jgi:hypothetical protein
MLDSLGADGRRYWIVPVSGGPFLRAT